MKKYLALFVVVAVLLMIDFSFAQSPRGGTDSEGKTSFTNIAVVGIDKNGTNGTTNPGLPGYIEMVSTGGSTYYLYINYSGRLCIASDVAVGSGASPSIIGWTNASGVIVGNQN